MAAEPPATSSSARRWRQRKALQAPTGRPSSGGGDQGVGAANWHS
uniref:Uncharacterized protein n=1 Tax=Arundo donax TaxID=35708 RepID=A0A0A9FB39_ARUDO